MWVSQNKILLSCSSRYLHIALSALDTICLALCYLPGFPAPCAFSHCLLSSFSHVTFLSFARSVSLSELRCYGGWRNSEQPLVCGGPLLKLEGGVSCCSVTQLSKTGVSGVCPILLHHPARARPAAAFLAGELPSPSLLECLLLLTHNSPDIPSTTSQLSGIN